MSEDPISAAKASIDEVEFRAYDMPRKTEEDLVEEAGKWEAWREKTEAEWRANLRRKEQEVLSNIEKQVNGAFFQRADDLRRAQEEAGRLEVRLRTALDSADRTKSELKTKEEQMNLRLAQKTQEITLMQKRVRDEAKMRVDSERYKSEALQKRCDQMEVQLERQTKRAYEAEKEYEAYRNNMKNAPETMLREEVSRLKALLSDSKAEIERERRLRSEAELEKEHFRSQMYNLALALKREREKSAVQSRQDLESLRLEFLAREERYVLDGDKDELRNIRAELNSIRSQFQLSQA